MHSTSRILILRSLRPNDFILFRFLGEEPAVVVVLAEDVLASEDEVFLSKDQHELPQELRDASDCVSLFAGELLQNDQKNFKKLVEVFKTLFVFGCSVCFYAELVDGLFMRRYLFEFNLLWDE